jgi:hypothetical protein
MTQIPDSPEDVREDRPGAWMQTNSGGQFFPLDPRPEEVNANDFANGLALTCRYGGQGRITRFYSVAEHCHHMAMYALANDMGPEFALHCLLHDAAEGYVGDMIRAMKVAVPEFKIVEGAVEQAVFTRYKLHPTAIEFGAVKTLDQRIVPLEKQFLFGEKGLDWAFDQFAPLDGVTIQGWMPVQAKLNYIVLHNRLCHLSGRDYLTEPGDFK